MNIKKTQGQTPKVIGWQLEQPCFSRGQHYVGASCAGANVNPFVLALQNKKLLLIKKYSLMNTSII